MPNILLKQNDFKYVVVNTGYIGKLINTFGFVHYEKKQIKVM